MTATPDPKTVREIAREHIRSHRDIGVIVSQHIPFTTYADFSAWCDAVALACQSAIVSWPNEQQPKATDESAARVRVRAWLDEWSLKVQSNLVATGCGRHESDGCTELTAPDIDALLAELEQLRETARAVNEGAAFYQRKYDEVKARAEAAEVLVRRYQARALLNGDVAEQPVAALDARTTDGGAT